MQGFRKPEFLKALELWQEDVRKVPSKEVQNTVLPVLKEIDLDAYPRTDRHSLPVLKEIDLGARRSHVDWELTDRMREEGIALMLPDMQGFRQVATLLAARARTEAVRGSFGKAAYSLQTGYKFSRDIADAPLLITALVGISMTGQMLVQTEEIIQLPGSPNLYWALTDLPQPFISTRRAYEGERLWSLPIFRDESLSPKALNTLVPRPD